MVTLRQLFTVFGHDPQWNRLAVASTPAMVTVFLRKLGDRDVTTLTAFDLLLQLQMSDQPQERKTKAESCMRHLLQWGREQGKTVPDLPDREPEPRETREPQAKKPSPYRNLKKKSPAPQEAVRTYVQGTVRDIHDNSLPSSLGSRASIGTIYRDTGAKGDHRSCRRRRTNCYRAEVTIDGQRYRHRSSDRDDCVAWLRAIKQGIIKPWENKADWWLMASRDTTADWRRMEQRGDMEARADELIKTGVEEACMVRDYRQSGDATPVFQYVEQVLLPHMVYYCCHTLRMPLDRTLSVSKQAAGLILTKICGGSPVTNITFYCKKLIRTYERRGDFWYHERAPRDVRLLIDGVDLAPLERLYKVTRDKRLRKQ